MAAYVQKAPLITDYCLLKKCPTVTTSLRASLLFAGHFEALVSNMSDVRFLRNTVWVFTTVTAKNEKEATTDGPNIRKEAVWQCTTYTVCLLGWSESGARS